MAILATFKVITKRGRILTISGAAGPPTITPRMVYKGSMHAFGLNAPEVGGGMGGAFGVLDTGGTSVAESDSYYTTVPTANTVLALHDHVTRTDPRFTMELQSRMEWWDAATPGVAGAMTFIGAIQQNVIEVADIGLLTVGQGISGTGIPPSCVITGLFVKPTVAGVAGIHYARLSHALTVAATATTATVATLTGSNYRGGVWLHQEPEICDEVTKLR